MGLKEIYCYYAPVLAVAMLLLGVWKIMITSGNPEKEIETLGFPVTLKNHPKECHWYFVLISFGILFFILTVVWIVLLTVPYILYGVDIFEDGPLILRCLGIIFPVSGVVTIIYGYFKAFRVGRNKQ